MPMAGLFRPLLAQWAAAPQPVAWTRLWNASLMDPFDHWHPQAWAPMHAGMRLMLKRQRTFSLGEPRGLWRIAEANTGEVPAPLGYGLQQSALWQLVMCTSRRELFALALWCGAGLVRHQVASSVDRETAQRWRRRLGERLYRDVLLTPPDLGRCKPAPPLRDLLGGRLIVDIGLSALADWAADPQDWAARRIALAAGPRHRAALYTLGPGILQPNAAATVQPSLLAFVQRHGDGH